MSDSRQLPLPVPFTWGGRRPGAGRKPTGRRAGVPHSARPAHLGRHPVHATLRARSGVGSLRAARVFGPLREALAAASKPTFRLVHFSVQADHIHLLVEAPDQAALSLGMRGLTIRLARAANRALGRRGAVWADRYHARALTTPREVRHALVYILMNWKKHRPDSRGIDPCSSGFWFTGWRGRPALPPADVRSPVAAPRTWLGRDGWQRHGLIAIGETPRRPVEVRGGPAGTSGSVKNLATRP